MISITFMRDLDKLDSSKRYIEFLAENIYISSKDLFRLGEYAEIERIIRDVEKCEPVSQGIFKSKFNGMILGYDALSSGSKTIIGLFDLIKNDEVSDKIIDITDCGFNAIKYILNNYGSYNLNLYLGHTNVSVDDKFKDRFLLNGECVNKFSID